jgi:hypothetical protein
VESWIDSPPLSFVGVVSAESKLIEPSLLLCHFFRGRAVARAVVIDEITGRVLAGSCGIRATDGLQLFMTVAVSRLLRVHGGSADNAVRTASNEHTDTYEDRRVNTSHSSILSRTVAIIPALPSARALSMTRLGRRDAGSLRESNASGITLLVRDFR